MIVHLCGFSIPKYRRMIESNSLCVVVRLSFTFCLQQITKLLNYILWKNSRIYSSMLTIGKDSRFHYRFSLFSWIFFITHLQFEWNTYHSMQRWGQMEKLSIKCILIECATKCLLNFNHRSGHLLIIFWKTIFFLNCNKIKEKLP